MERDQLDAKITHNSDVYLLEELHLLTGSLLELDRKIDGGLESLGFIDEPVHILAAHNKIDMQITKMALLLESACESLLKRAGELEVEGVDEDSAEKIMLAEYYTALVGTIKSNPALQVVSKSESEGPVECGGDAISVVKKKVGRRNMLSGAMLGMGFVAVAGMTATPKASALVASDPAVLASLEKFYASFTISAKERYMGMIETINSIQGLFNALDVVNKAIIGGVDALLSVTNEEHMKSIVAQTTAADQQRLQKQQHKVKDVEQGSKSGSGSCVNDAASVVDKNMKNQRRKAGEIVSKSMVVGKLFGTDDDEMPISGDERISLIVKDLQGRNGNAFNAGVIIETTVENTPEGREGSEKVFNALVTERSGTVYSGLAQAANTIEGQERIIQATTRVARRSVSEAVLARTIQGTVGEPGAYQFLAVNLENLIRDTPPNAWDEDGNPKESILDSRMVAHAEELRKELDVISGGRKAISMLESLDFQVDAYSSSSFNEFVRASGYHPTPLLREITGQNSLLLKMMLEQVKSSREATALLSLVLLELQDNA